MDLYFDEEDWEVEGNGQYLSAGDWETGKTSAEWDPITGNIGIQTLNFGPLLPFFEQTQELVLKAPSHINILQDVTPMFIDAILAHTEIPGDTNRVNRIFTDDGAQPHKMYMVAFNEDKINGKIAGLAFLGKPNLVHSMRPLRYIIFDNGDNNKK